MTGREFSVAGLAVREQLAEAVWAALAAEAEQAQALVQPDRFTAQQRVAVYRRGWAGFDDLWTQVDDLIRRAYPQTGCSS